MSVRQHDERQELNADLAWLRNQALSSFSKESHTWVFSFSDGSVLRSDCPWRIVSGGSVALGFEDHEQLFGLPEPVDAIRLGHKLLAGQHVTGVDLSAETADLIINFSGGARLDLFNASSGYEGWVLLSAGGPQFVALGGGGLVRS